jgi:hypothetical protein
MLTEYTMADILRSEKGDINNWDITVLCEGMVHNTLDAARYF